MARQLDQKKEDMDHASTNAEETRRKEVMRVVDRHQARGNVLAQMGRVLTEEEQKRAKAEILAYEF